ncbi:MAG: PDGLE domain-containing protein [Methanobacteriaceae archaeon]|nr:PDGLE domain-containing protein [Methanobacteriaceae archaeon]
MSRNKFIIGGLGLIILLGIIAPFLASSEPDGLEATLEQAGTVESDDTNSYESPMPDYSLPILGDSPSSLILASVIGILVVFGLTYSVMLILKKQKE